MAQIDYYKVLQIDPEAEPEIVKAVYWRLSQKYHPDGSNPDPDKMRQINDAHEVIGDPARRKRYDSHRQYGWDSSPDSDAAQSLSYWKPPESTFNPDARTARKPYRQPSIPAPLGIFGALAIVAFLAIMLQSGFGYVQRAALSAAKTSTPAPADRWFAITVDELRSFLEAEGFAFESDVFGAKSSTSANKDLQVEVLIVERGNYVKSLEINLVSQNETAEQGLMPNQRDLVTVLLEKLGASEAASEFLVDSVDLWNEYEIDNATFQSSGVVLELTADPETQTVSMHFIPAP